MKKILLFSLLVMTSICFTPQVSTASVAATDFTTLVEKINAKNGAVASEKPAIKEKFAARHFKKLLQKSQDAFDGMHGGRRFSPLAFLFGFIFSWVGVLIVWIFGGNARSAAIGAIVSLILWILLIIAA